MEKRETLVRLLGRPCRVGGMRGLVIVIMNLYGAFTTCWGDGEACRVWGHFLKFLDRNLGVAEPQA